MSEMTTTNNHCCRGTKRFTSEKWIDKTEAKGVVLGTVRTKRFRESEIEREPTFAIKRLGKSWERRCSAKREENLRLF